MQDIKIFTNGGMNLDDALENIAPNDYIEAYNIDNIGISDSEEGYVTNIESFTPVPMILPDGINKTIGVGSFPSIRKIIDFTYNSAGYHTINEFDYDTGIRTTLFKNMTDSGGVDVLSLDPEIYVKDIKLIDDKFIFFLPSSREPSIFNLDRLRNKDYGVVTIDDFTLIKEPPHYPVQLEYKDDSGVGSNLLYGKLFQARYQFIYIDNEPSAWSVISDRPVPNGVKSVQIDVTKDNNLKLSLDAGNNRVKEIRIAIISNDDTVWKEIRNISREDMLKLNSTPVSPEDNIRESYDPVTNKYEMLFYNNGNYQSIDVLATDLDYDAVPLTSQAAEVANGNVLLLANNKEGYDIPKVDVNLSVSYEPSGIDVINTDIDAIVFTGMRVRTIPEAGLLGGRRGVYDLYFKGTVKTGDKIVIRQIGFYGSDKGNILNSEYIIPSSQNGNNIAAFNSFGANDFQLGYGVESTSSGITFRIVLNYRYELLDVATYVVASTGSTDFNSKRSIKLNSSYDTVLLYFDKYGRYFPSAKSGIINTVSYASTEGNIPVINWRINSDPPKDAVYYQFGITKNLTHLRWVYVNATLVKPKGSWNASGNSPELKPNEGNIGDFYRVSMAGKQDLGGGSLDYNVGDYVIYNGLTWDRILYEQTQSSSGQILDVGNNANILTLNVGSLKLYNKNNSTSVINYDFSVGDKCTIHYADDGTTKTYFNNPAIDVEIVGYDYALGLLRIRRPNDFDPELFADKEFLLELYTPKKQNTSEDDNVFFEIGDVYPVINGKHSVIEGTFKELDSFIKTREYVNANDYSDLDMYLVEDSNYSDFYISDYYPFGRPHIYNSLAKQNINKADIRYSDVINNANGVNLLNRFYPERVEIYDYTKGGIMMMIQRGNMLICLQELEYCYVPVEQSIIEDQASRENVGISDKLLNKARYPENNQAGIGNATESFAYYKGNIFFIDPFRSEPCRIGYNGLTYIKAKLSKFFKRNIQEDYKAGRKQIGWIDVFKEDYVLSTEYDGDIVVQVPFRLDDWDVEDKYIAPYPYNFAIETSFNGATILNIDEATFTPNNDFVGNGGFTFSFDTETGREVKKACVNVSAGSQIVSPFSFIDLFEQPLSTWIESNIILVFGNNIPVPISIINGEYQINDDGIWRTYDSTVNSEDIVKVRVTSSSIGNTTTSTTLTIGNQSATFNVTTMVVSGVKVHANIITGLLNNVYFKVNSVSGTDNIYDFYPDIIIPSPNQKLRGIAIPNTLTPSIQLDRNITGSIGVIDVMIGAPYGVNSELQYKWSNRTHSVNSFDPPVMANYDFFSIGFTLDNNNRLSYNITSDLSFSTVEGSGSYEVYSLSSIQSSGGGSYASYQIVNHETVPLRFAFLVVDCGSSNVNGSGSSGIIGSIETVPASSTKTITLPATTGYKSIITILTDKLQSEEPIRTTYNVDIRDNNSTIDGILVSLDIVDNTNSQLVLTSNMPEFVLETIDVIDDNGTLSTHILNSSGFTGTFVVSNESSTYVKIKSVVHNETWVLTDVPKENLFIYIEP